MSRLIEKNFFDQPVKIYLISYEKIQKIATGKGDNYTTGCLLVYNYFKNYCAMIAINLSEQQALEADSKAIQRINFTKNLVRHGQTTMYFITEKTKKKILFCFDMMLM